MSWRDEMRQDQMGLYEILIDTRMRVVSIFSRGGGEFKGRILKSGWDNPATLFPKTCLEAHAAKSIGKVSCTKRLTSK